MINLNKTYMLKDIPEDKEFYIYSIFYGFNGKICIQNCPVRDFPTKDRKNKIYKKEDKYYIIEENCTALNIFEQDIIKDYKFFETIYPNKEIIFFENNVKVNKMVNVFERNKIYFINNSKIRLYENNKLGTQKDQLFAYTRNPVYSQYYYPFYTRDNKYFFKGDIHFEYLNKYPVTDDIIFFENSV